MAYRQDRQHIFFKLNHKLDSWDMKGIAFSENQNIWVRSNPHIQNQWKIYYLDINKILMLHYKTFQNYIEHMLEQWYSNKYFISKAHTFIHQILAFQVDS